MVCFSAHSLCNTSPSHNAAIEPHTCVTRSNWPLERPIFMFLARMKSPSITALCDCQRALADGRPRRVSDSSITSSWISDATWIISTSIAARCTLRPLAAPSTGEFIAADSITNNGRMPFPREESA